MCPRVLVPRHSNRIEPAASYHARACVHPRHEYWTETRRTRTDDAGRANHSKNQSSVFIDAGNLTVDDHTFKHEDVSVIHSERSEKPQWAAKFRKNFHNFSGPGRNVLTDA